MVRKLLYYIVDLPHNIFSSSTVRSQLDCVDTVPMSENLLIRYVPPGTVCIKCSVGGEVANDSMFQIDGSDIDASTGRVVDGVLVVFDTESVFSISSSTDVQCMTVNLNASHSVKIYLESKLYRELCFHYMRALNLVFRPPVITGNTALNEGDTLYLDCDTLNFKPHFDLAVKWFSPERVVVSYGETLVITNIQSNAAGIYTCVVTRIVTGATTNSTVDVTVQCKCQVNHVYTSMYGSWLCTYMIYYVHVNQIELAVYQERIQE